jgi:hypothetical protein
LLTPALTAADPAPAPAPQAAATTWGARSIWDRLILGGSVGAAKLMSGTHRLTCVECSPGAVGLALTGHIGGWATPRLAILVEVHRSSPRVIDPTAGAKSFFQNGITMTGRYYTRPRLWFGGGIGTTYLSWSDEVVTTNIMGNLSITASAGYELRHGRNVSIDVLARLMAGIYGIVDEDVETASVGIGVNWR